MRTCRYELRGTLRIDTSLYSNHAYDARDQFSNVKVFDYPREQFRAEGMPACAPANDCDAHQFETKAPTLSSNRICKTCQEDHYRAATPVVWDKFVHTKSDKPGELRKVSSHNTWNGGAVSKQKFDSDVTLEFNCYAHNHITIGFTKKNSNAHYNDIECALYCDNGHLYSSEQYNDHSDFHVNHRRRGFGYYSSRDVM